MSSRPDRFQKPGNALKRAEELIGVGHRLQALNVLQEVLSTKRALAKDKKHQGVFEQIMFKYIELCVYTRDAKRVKDGLHQYKSLCNSIGSMNPLSSVIRRFLHLSEQRTAEAQASFERQKNAQLAEEKLKTETMASRLLLEVSGEGMTGRLERQIVTPWHKFIWDSYRSVLEILRNIPKLESLYHETARHALNFCVTYRRKTEFRRLADMLRFHLTSLQKTLNSIIAKAENEGDEEPSDRPDPEQVNLSHPETQVNQLETRYLQLSAACDLGLWAEAFRAIEDIRTLLNIRVFVESPSDSIAETRNAFVRKFTAKLADIFWVSQNHTFHAYFLLRHLDLLKIDQRTPELCTALLLAALSIELQNKNDVGTASFDLDDQLVKNTKLAAMLGVPIPPSRDALLTLLMAPEGPYNLGKYVMPELADIYELIEQRFHPLQLCKLVKPKLDLIASTPSLTQYLEPLTQLILIRLFQQLGQVYSKMRFANLRNLAFFYDFYTLEITVLNAVRQRLIDVRFDHQSGNINFNCRALASDDLRSELTNLAHHLQVASNLIHPERARNRSDHRRSVFQTITASIEAEHRNKIERAAEIERRKKEADALLRKEAEEQARIRAEQAERLAAENALKEKERIAQLELQRKEAKEKKQKAWKVQRTATDITPGLVADVSTELPNPASDIDERREKIRKIREDKERIESRYKQLGVEVDHFERAKRQHERRLLEANFQAQLQKDHEHTQKQREEAIKKAQAEHQEALAERDRLGRMLQFRRQYEAQVLESQKVAFEALRQEEENRKLNLRQRLAEAELREKAEEEQRLQREAEERRLAEERAEQDRIDQDKREAEKRQKDQELKERMAERLRAAEKQRQREEEAAARQAALFSSPKTTSSPASEGKWETQGRRPERAPVERWTPSRTNEPPSRQAKDSESPAHDESPSRYEPPRRSDRYEPPRRDEPPRSDRYEPPRRTGDRDRYEPPRGDRYEPPRRGGDRDEPPRGDRYEPSRRGGDRDEPPRSDRYEPPRRGGDRDEPPRRSGDRDEPPRGDRYEPPRRGNNSRYEPPRRDSPSKGNERGGRGRW